jgi:hypothetical protein
MARTVTIKVKAYYQGEIQIQEEDLGLDDDELYDKYSDDVEVLFAEAVSGQLHEITSIDVVVSEEDA